MTLRDFAARSRATPAFLDAIDVFQRDHRPSKLVRFHERAPSVKVERALTQLIAKHPDLAIESVRVEGTSGCEFFRGEIHLVAHGEARCIRFHWDCRWKAEQMGWQDYFGYPDQIRAAREFGHDCFRDWEIVSPQELEIAVPLPG